MSEYARCPSCGRTLVLLTLPTHYVARQRTDGSIFGETWGEPTVAPAHPDARAECNFASCGWVGVVDDLIQAT